MIDRKEPISNEQKASMTNGAHVELLDNVQYIVNNGIIVDTILIDSLIEMAIIQDTINTENKIFLSYAVYANGKTVKGEPVNNFIGHFVCSIKSGELPVQIGNAFVLNKLHPQEKPLNLGSSCSSENDIIEFENIRLLPLLKNCFYFIIPQCSGWADQCLIEYRNGQFDELFAIESDEDVLSFNFENDTILTFNYKENDENEIKYYKYRFDIKNRKTIE